MNIRRCSNPLNINGIEEWMTQFFTDPFTNLLDEQTFRVDLFETNENYIIEAELGKTIEKEDIQVCTSIETVKISVQQKRVEHQKKGKQSDEIITRTVILPYKIEDKVIIASFINGILEVKISKLCSETQTRTSIPIEG